MAYPGLGYQIGPTQSHRRLGEEAEAEAEADGRCQAAG